ncbi:MAG: ATP-binding protein [Bacteroidales bacterium]|jgi:predicted AAA+ superfamily ATPase|nr:ATP-binding protein [Bacteroidales bacterium]
MKEYIERPLYIDRIKPYIGKNLIKVLTGQRRVGKSYLMMQIRDLIRENEPGTRIIYINKELHEFSMITDNVSLLEYVNRQHARKGKVALFIDEIQDIDSFEKALRDLVTRKNFDIYCTGSNARLLSGELATLLSGRYIEIRVYGLSYPEYIMFRDIKDSAETFRTYLREGGLPFLIHMGSDVHVVNEYLNTIYNTILLKDVVARYNIRNVKFMENLVLFLAGNIGSIVSARKISEYLKSQKINISIQVVIDYLGYLESSFLIHRVRRSGIMGKRIFEIGEKYFFSDIGIRNVIAGYNPTDIHKILENVVFLHLRIAGYDVTVGSEGGREIDFIASRGGKRIYVQVAYLLEKPETAEREFGNLLEIRDNFPKYVVTMDELNETDSYLGIHRIHVKDFCRMLAE